MFRAVASLLLYGSLSSFVSPSSPFPLPPLPTVASLPIVEDLRVGGTFSASGAIVMDIESGKEIFAFQADQQRAIGSLTKLVTALIIIENYDLDEVVTVPSGMEEIEGTVAGLRAGERFRIRDLLAALLVSSANDAAYALAIFHSGSIEAFAEEMNARSRILGLLQTHFKNPAGFDQAGQVSTPRELAWLSLYVLKNDFLRTLGSQRRYTIWELRGHRVIHLESTNRLLLSHPNQFHGLKTGTTERAGECLIAVAKIAGRRYLLVVLGSADRYRDALLLFDALSTAQAV